MKPTYFFSAYQYPEKGAILTTRQIKQKCSEICTAEVWFMGDSEPTERSFNSWTRDGNTITARDLNGDSRYFFEIRKISEDRYSVEKTEWA